MGDATRKAPGDEVGVGRGSVEALFVAPDAKPAPMEPVDQVEAVAGRGIRGDRYFCETGTYSVREDLEPASDVTLIEAEAIEACRREYGIDIPSGGTRRNVTTRDVPLNHLVDREFRVGTATCRGLSLCEPCQPMAEHVGEPGVVQALVHRGGLNAAIVASGRIGVDDPIRY